MLKKLEDMCHDLNFNKEEAIDLIKKVDVNKEFEIRNNFGYSHDTILIAEAICNYNIEMLRLLLENGADPNKIYGSDSCELWGLLYNHVNAHPEENECSLKMAQLLLEFGGNPNIIADPKDEDLFSCVLFKVYNESGEYWKYISRFFILLVAYGGKNECCVPNIVGEFDKSNMAKYRLWLFPDDHKQYGCYIEDQDKNIVAYI